MSTGVVECLLAVAFGDLDAIAAAGILREGAEERLDQFEGWTLVDLLTDRFDIAHPLLRFEVAHEIERCAGDPLELLYLASQDLESASSSGGHQRFPLGMFTGAAPPPRSVGFDIADAHLHSGASIPLRLFFDALASGADPVDRAALAGKTLRSRGGKEWDLHTVLAATRWALRLVRYVRAGESLGDVKTLTERGFHHVAVERVLAGTFWERVKEEATSDSKSDRWLLEMMDRRFEYEGLCKSGNVLWRVSRKDEYEFTSRRRFVTGLVRACAAVASVVTSRPGEGLSRFVDRFGEMGLARDASLGGLKSMIARTALDYMAASDDVIGAEFRKTIVADGPKDFGRRLFAALADHNHAFSSFVDDEGRAMALSMPVGFKRHPISAAGEEWTDLEQLRSAVDGYNALRLALIDDDGTLTSAIGLVDVAGDEYGSASWPYAVAAELLRRETALVYAIHAGESFYSQLNGVRRVGELFLGDRAPERIGHALALDGNAAQAVCVGMVSAPVRIGDAICDLAWTVAAGCGDEATARRLLYRVVEGPAGKALDPDAWIDAYRALFKVDALMHHGVLYDSGGRIGACDADTLEDYGRTGDETAMALCALVCGAGPRVAYADVKAPVPAALLPELRAFGDATAAQARTLVLRQVKNAGTAIESCPTSNVRLAKLQDVGGHPMWKWTSRKHKVKVVVGSDDPLIFGATITDEFGEMLAVKSEATVKKIAAETVSYCGGGHRRTLPEFQVVAALADRRARKHKRRARKRPPR